MLEISTLAVLISAVFCRIPSYENNATKPKYDYVIVGAGSAGSALANRLSEDSKYSVLLLEAGGPPPEMSEIPMLMNALVKTDAEWDNYTEPQKKACLSFPGQVPLDSVYKALGGGSSHNHMMYVRGNKKDYDNWERMGAKGWNYNSVLEIFKKIENFTITDYKDNGYHGQEGCQTVSPLQYQTKMGDAFLAAAKSLGYKTIDYNGPSQHGFSAIQVSQRDGLRCSTEKAFLRPALKGDNLDILTRAFVLKVTFDNNKQVKSVIFDHQKATKEIQVQKEVIISAGTISSAKILLLSGIGPKKHLDEMQIPVVADIPGVGKNLQDHLFISHISYSINDSAGIIYKEALSKKYFDQLRRGKGPLTSPGLIEVAGFVNTKNQSSDENWPDGLLLGLSTTCQTLDAGLDSDQINGTGIVALFLRPKSRGVFKLRSNNPYDDPVIDPNYFSDENDMRKSIDLVRKAMDIMETPSVQRYKPQLYSKGFSGCENLDPSSDGYIKCAIERFAEGGAHLVGTCKMGDPKDNTTVVDPQLRVKGVTGLRVADASIMPAIVSATLNAPCIMIGYKAAEIILSNEK